MRSKALFKDFSKYVSLSVLGQIALSCYTLSDTFFVSAKLGADGLTALNLAFPIFCILNGTGLMIGMGGGTKYSIYRSREESGKADRIFTNAIYLAALFACIFATAGAFFSEHIVKFLGADETLLDMTNTYAKVMLLFAPAFLLNNLLQCFVRNDDIVISLHDYYNKRLKLINPEAYVDSDLSSEQVKLYIAWVIERCGATPQEYSVKENQKELETPAETPLKVHEQPEETFAATLDIALTKEAEDYLLQCDLNGATYGELQSKLGYTMVGTKEIVARSPHIIEMNRKLYHEDALVDLEEGAETLDEILDKLLKKNNGIATAKHLYEYARSEMAMFFNDNDITDQQSVYDLARYLFEKLKYHGKRYVFKSNMYISLPDVSADSVIDIVKKYAIEKGSTVTFKEIESYMTGLGANTGNLRMSMRIDKEPVFLIYAENEYLLAELMHIDAAFLESIRSALKRLFEDNDGHIIPRNISDSWYGLLPALPSCLPWTPMLLQQLIRFYPNELDARTIIAMASQSSNTLNAIFVEKESWIHDFRDVVAVFLHDEMPNRSEFEAEELRGILVDAGMISGNELICNMHNALGSDPRFLWNSDGSHVKVRI